MTYFIYGETELEHLKQADVRLAQAIDRIGMIQRKVNPDLFSALIEAIIGQQISTKAHITISKRMHDHLQMITPQRLTEISKETLQSFGLTHRKVEYIKQIAQQVEAGKLNIESLQQLSDEEVCIELSKLNGVGVWTAEMLMTFSMQRPNIISYGDLAIQRGLRMLYHHRNIDKKKFAKYKRRYAPYASIASLYLWEIAGGAIPEMKDYAPKKKK
jgi:DNA-3-methyladenine glycosylase II